MRKNRSLVRNIAVFFRFYNIAKFLFYNSFLFFVIKYYARSYFDIYTSFIRNNLKHFATIFLTNQLFPKMIKLNL